MKTPDLHYTDVIFRMCPNRFLKIVFFHAEKKEGGDANFCIRLWIKRVNPKLPDVHKYIMLH